jgi:hypothetical protein
MRMPSARSSRTSAKLRKQYVTCSHSYVITMYDYLHVIQYRLLSRTVILVVAVVLASFVMNKRPMLKQPLLP